MTHLGTMLVVCTANQCRSPMAEVLARDMFARAGIDMAVTSAGTAADDGIEATEYAEVTVSRLGLDLTGHLSQPVSDELVDAASLIVCMERAHVVDVCAERPAAFERTFTLKDLARRAETTHRHPVEPLDHWLRRIGADRNPVDQLGRSKVDDVADPIGRSLRRYRKTAEEIAGLLTIVVQQLNPPVAA